MLLAVILVLDVFNISLPPWMDLFGSSVTERLNAGAQEITFSLSYYAEKLVLLVIGMSLVLISVRPNDKESLKPRKS